MFDDAVATQDTVTQLTATMRRWPGWCPARMKSSAGCVGGLLQPGKPPIDWDDPVAKEKLVSDLVSDALAVLAS